MTSNDLTPRQVVYLDQAIAQFVRDLEQIVVVLLADEVPPSAILAVVQSLELWYAPILTHELRTLDREPVL